MDKCPTCTSPVIVNKSDDGTCYFQLPMTAIQRLEKEIAWRREEAKKPTLMSSVFTKQADALNYALTVLEKEETDG